MSIETDSVHPTGPARTEDLLVHAAWVRGVAYALVRDAATADDLVQETWLAALKRPPELGRPLRPWLGAVVRNLVRQRRRGEARRERREETVATRRAENALPTPAELAERLEAQQMLAAHVKELAEPFRATVLLRYFEGISAAEIAKRQGEPAGTVRWRLKRGLELLRERLDAEHDGDRRAWALALCPIAVLPDPKVGGGPGTGLVAAAVEGVVAMSFGAKIVMGGAAGLAALLLLAVSVNAVFGGAGGETAPTAPVEVSFRPESDVRADRRRVERGPDAPVATEESAPIDEGPVAPVAVLTTLEGRALDEHGGPLAGVRVREQLGEETVTGADGRFVLSSAVFEGMRTIEVRLTAPARAKAVTDVPVTRGETSYVGDIELAPGGTISGRVLDADRRPVAGAWVGGASEDEISSPYAMRRRMHQWSLRERDSVVTGSDGTFTLTGVRAGTRRIWAGGDTYLATLSGPIEVRAGVESYGVELVLDKLAEEDVISGRVVAPDGTPLPDAQLRYSYDSGWSGSGSGTMSLERDGTFLLILTHDTDYSFSASDREDRWGGISIADVAPGTRDLELRLPENRYVSVVVVDRAGARVSEFQATTYDPKNAILFGLYDSADGAPGGARIRVPAQAFHVKVEADGFDAGLAGPFSADAVPETIRVQLDALPGMRGNVTLDGLPVAGAKVGAHLAVAVDQSFVHNGFPTRWQPSAEESTVTAEDGTFALTVRTAGRYVIRVESEGVAPFEIGPFTYDPAAGRGALDAKLSTGGTIEGVVDVDAGRGPAGTIVGISRAVGHPVSQRVGPDGLYRFDHLTPGEWEVRRLDEDIVAGNSSSTTTRGEFRPNWSCTVRDGAVTTHDLVASYEKRVTLKARVRVNGEGAAGWLVSLLEGTDEARSSAASVELGYEGDGELAATRAGSFRVLVTSSRGPLYVMRDVNLEEGENRVELDIDLGSASICGVPSRKNETPASGLALVWLGDDGWFALVPLLADKKGFVEVAEIPAGVVHIRRLDHESFVADPATWPIVSELTVPSGGTVELNLDEN